MPGGSAKSVLPLLAHRLCLHRQVLEGVADRIVSTYLPLLHRLVDAISLLDMLHGFAQVASGSPVGQGGRAGAAAPAAAVAAGRGYVRPALTEGGPIALVEARHPMLECLDWGSYQPNDTFLALNSSFHIITGGLSVLRGLAMCAHNCVCYQCKVV